MIKWSARLSIIGAQWSFIYLFSTQRLHYLSFQPWHLFWNHDESDSWLADFPAMSFVFVCGHHKYKSVKLGDQLMLDMVEILSFFMLWCFLVFARWYWTWKYCQVWWLVFWLFWLIMIGDENGVSMSKWHGCVQSCESMSNLEQLMWHSGIEVLVKI